WLFLRRKRQNQSATSAKRPGSTRLRSRHRKLYQLASQFLQAEPKDLFIPLKKPRKS
ncbi:LSU ribosomal protein L32p @ LSU ribosomal protein L32p, zinc-independent, partial [uncultured Synechococcales cyanobacterium]